jgi:hypothetical protein
VRKDLTFGESQNAYFSSAFAVAISEQEVGRIGRIIPLALSSNQGSSLQLMVFQEYGILLKPYVRLLRMLVSLENV